MLPVVLLVKQQPNLWCFPSANKSRSGTPNAALILICFTFLVLNWMFSVNQGLSFGDFHLLVAGSSKLC